MSIGEWWIEDRWTVTHADGEIGQNHHECVVLIRAINELVNEIRDKIPSWELKDDYDGDYHWLVEDLNNTESEDYWNDMIKAGIEYRIISRALDMNHDHRLVGMRDYGWSAVRNDRVDTWNLSRKKAIDIGEGLLEIGELTGKQVFSTEFVIQDLMTPNISPVDLCLAGRRLFRGTPEQLAEGEFSAYSSCQPVSSL